MRHDCMQDLWEHLKAHDCRLRVKISIWELTSMVSPDCFFDSKPYRSSSTAAMDSPEQRSTSCLSACHQC